MRLGWVRIASFLGVLVGGVALASPAFAHGHGYWPSPSHGRGWGSGGGGTPRKSAPEIDPLGAGAAAGLLVGGVLFLEARRRQGAPTAH